MVIALTLEHTKIKGRQMPYHIVGVDANEAARISQTYNKATMELFVSDVIKAKLPTHLYNFKVTDWTFSDDRALDGTVRDG